MKPLSALVAALFAVIVLFSDCQAKRGCSLYGHSCFGGHGKRSDTLDSDVNYFDEPNRAVNSLGNKEFPVYLNTFPKGPDFKGYNIPIPEKNWKYTVYALLHQIINDSKKNQQNDPTAPSDFDADN